MSADYRGSGRDGDTVTPVTVAGLGDPQGTGRVEGSSQEGLGGAEQRRRVARLPGDHRLSGGRWDHAPESRAAVTFPQGMKTTARPRRPMTSPPLAGNYFPRSRNLASRARSAHLRHLALRPAGAPALFAVPDPTPAALLATASPFPASPLAGRRCPL